MCPDVYQGKLAMDMMPHIHTMLHLHTCCGTVITAHSKLQFLLIDYLLYVVALSTCDQDCHRIGQTVNKVKEARDLTYMYICEACIHSVDCICI